MMADRAIRLGAAVVVTALSLKLSADLKTKPVAGEQWPSPATLDSLRPFVRPVERGVHDIASFGYEQLSEHDPFEGAPSYVPTPDPEPAPRRVDVPTPQRARPTVTAILITGDQKVAVIDNTLVRIGSILPDGARVVGIERDHVQIVSRDGGRMSLRLNQGG